MSTFPEPTVTQLPGGFAAARLTVVADERVQNAEAAARGLGYSAGYAAGVRAAHLETEQLRTQLEVEATQQRAHNAQLVSTTQQAFATAIAAADARLIPLLNDSRALLYSLALDLASAALGVAVSQPFTETNLDSDTAVGTTTAGEGLSLGVVAALQRALDVPHDVAVTTIRMHPADAAQVTAHWEQLREHLGESAATVRILPDPSLEIGDAVSEFEDGFLDARLTTAMNRARAALDAELEAMELIRRSQSHSIDAASAGILPSSV